MIKSIFALGGILFVFLFSIGPEFWDIEDGARWVLIGFAIVFLLVAMGDDNRAA